MNCLYIMEVGKKVRFQFIEKKKLNYDQRHIQALLNKRKYLRENVFVFNKHKYNSHDNARRDTYNLHVNMPNPLQTLKQSSFFWSNPTLAFLDLTADTNIILRIMSL